MYDCQKKTNGLQMSVTNLEIRNSKGFLDAGEFLNNIERVLIRNIRRELGRHHGLKVNVVLST
jgi:hypothetical protein